MGSDEDLSTGNEQLVNPSLLARFRAYEEDFERTFVDDDWHRLEKYFAANAVYSTRVTGCVCRGVIRCSRRFVQPSSTSIGGATNEHWSRQKAQGKPPTV